MKPDQINYSPENIARLLYEYQQQKSEWEQMELDEATLDCSEISQPRRL